MCNIPHLAGIVGTGCCAHIRSFFLLLFVDFQLLFVSALIRVVIGYHGLSISFKVLDKAGSTPEAMVIMCCQSLQLHYITEYNTAFWFSFVAVMSLVLLSLLLMLLSLEIGRAHV